jgi:hypothetical protein
MTAKSEFKFKPRGGELNTFKYLVKVVYARVAFD